MKAVEITLLSDDIGGMKYGYHFKQVGQAVLIREVTQDTSPNFINQPLEFDEELIKVWLTDIDRVIAGLQAMKLLANK